MRVLLRPIVIFSKKPMIEIQKITHSFERNVPEDKWKFLYEYARKSLDEDLKRFQAIDDKAAKFLTLVTVVFGVFSSITPWIFENWIPPSDAISWFLIVLVGLTFIVLVLSWSLLFRAIKLIKAPRMPLTDSLIQFFWEKEFPDIYFALTKTCKAALGENRKVIKRKGELIKNAYICIAISAWLVAADVSLIILSKLNS